jgi:hypothetical protein
VSFFVAFDFRLAAAFAGLAMGGFPVISVATIIIPPLSYRSRAGNIS